MTVSKWRSGIPIVLTSGFMKYTSRTCRAGLHFRSCKDVPMHNVRISDSDSTGDDDVPDGTVEALGNRARALENTRVYGKTC